MPQIQLKLLSMAFAAELILPRDPSSLIFYGIAQVQTKTISTRPTVTLINELNIIFFTECNPLCTRRL
ncbi:hypothetical protein QUH46_24390, partial [Klebsiella grimontii]|uniref:hypothetical protein n=1 Tax=Klebsiella grimontii TaxID=2058152 RepID=UPI0025A22756